MNLPKIDISALPDLDTLTGVFGSLANPGQSLQSDDSIVILMVFIYDILLPLPRAAGLPDAYPPGTGGAAA